MKKEEISQAWFIQTTNGESFLIITKHGGSWVSLFMAIKYKDSFYGIDITNINGNLNSLFSMITEDNVITFKDQEWKNDFYPEFHGEISTLQSYSIKFANGMTINSKEIRFLVEVYDRI